MVIPVRILESARAAPRVSFTALALLSLPFATALGQPRLQQASVAVAVQQPRAFGYVIGDRLEQRISLRAPAGLALDARSLPRAGRMGPWLELAAPRLTSTKTRDGTRYLLTLDYQVINVPEEVRAIDLPAISLAFSGRGSQASAIIDEWPVTIAPITPTFVLARAGLAQIQPDARPSEPDPGRYMWLTVLWGTLTLALIAGGIAQRRGIPWLRHRARPFAWATRDIAKLSRLPPDQTTYRRGLQRMHRAFDAAAGHAVFGERLTPLFTAHPELLSLHADIEQFYAASQREFFGARTGAANVGAILTLAKRCRDAEAASLRRPRVADSAARERRPRAV